MDIYHEHNGESFVWDAAKAAKNWHKHGVRFEEAATVFTDPFFRLVDAGRNGEARDAAIGFDATGRLLYLVHIEFAGSYRYRFRTPCRAPRGGPVCSLNACSIGCQRTAP